MGQDSHSVLSVNYGFGCHLLFYPRLTAINNSLPVKMKRDQEIEIFELVNKDYFYSMIVNHFKKKNVKICKASITHVKKKFENEKENLGQARLKPSNRGRPLALSNRQIVNLKKEVLSDNPKSHSDPGDKYGVHRTTISRYIKRYFGFKVKKKTKVHFLSESQKAVRFQRSKPLLNFLEKFLPFITTTDEKIFHLRADGGEKIFYYKNPKDQARYLVSRQPKSHPKSVMVWGGISWNGVTKLRFILPGAKIDSVYYIEKILKPFIREDLPRLYPDGKGILHQDSAPAHTAKNTLKFLDEQKINYIPPEMWTPNSPDNAPMDFSIWGIMVKELKKRKVTSVRGLKRTLTVIWSNLSLEMIRKVLNRWPKHCDLIHKYRGNNIEQFRRLIRFHSVDTNLRNRSTQFCT